MRSSFKIARLTRREFLAASGAAGGGLMLGVNLLSGCSSPEEKVIFAPNAFLRIGPDESVTVVVGRSEMGQGVYTSLPMLVAEELDADWRNVRVIPAPTTPAYNNPRFGMQGTGGSNSVASSWEPLRQAGASARAMLIGAAAAHWRVDARECTTEAGHVLHAPSGRRLSYGRLAARAAHLAPPSEVALKRPADYKIIGRSAPRLDAPGKTNGTAVFGIDVRLPGLLTALVARPATFGAPLKSFDEAAALAIPGVRRVVVIDAGVAIVADGFWSAHRGREALAPQWAEGPMQGFDEVQLIERYGELAQTPGRVWKDVGAVDEGLRASSRRLDAAYEFPFLAHVTMEPLNCTAHVRGDRCDVWVGTQFQTYDREAAAAAAGLPIEQVELHTTLLGGGFGRRGIPDGHFVREAVQISKIMQAPVKVIWTRDDDVRGGYYRPAYVHRATAGLSADGDVAAWRHRIVGQSILTGTQFERTSVVDGLDRSSIYWPYYAIPNIRIELHTTQTPVPVWAWRSVGATHCAFAVECFIDELAHAAGRDPVAYRRALLPPERAAVLALAAEKAGWGTPLPRGRGRGVALYPFDSFVAQIAEVSVAESGDVTVERVVCAIDCGTVVNPDIVRAQMEGGVIMGLSAALREQVTFADGRVEQSGFADYRVLRMPEAPRIEVHIVASDAPPRGVGEASVPPIAPAVANAIHAATGKRIRRLPIYGGAR